MKTLLRRWPLHLFAALSMAVLGLIFAPDDAAEIYSFARLRYLPLAALPLFLLSAWGGNRLLWPAWQKLEKGTRRAVLGAAAAFLLAGLWLFPPLQPDFAVPHTLRLSATGAKDKAAAGTIIEIVRLADLSGKPIDPSTLSASADWQTTGSGFISDGAAASYLELNAAVVGGVQLTLRYSPAGGEARVEWDGAVRELSLYAREPAELPLTLRGGGILTLPPGQAAAAALAALLYAAGIAFPLFGGLTLFFRLLGRRAPVLLQWGALLLAILLFGYLKSLYLKIDDPHIMGDTASYVATAQYPLTSARFWLGQRPFTIPLAVKAFGFTSADYYETGQLARWARFQVIFSALSWLTLAFSLAWSTSRRGLRVLLFILTLGFSLSMEIGLWDTLLLSESLSFSLLAWMLAGWLWLTVFLPRLRPGWAGWALVAAALAVTVLYAFGRDSNIYFVLCSAAALALMAIFDRRLRAAKAPLLVYAGAALLLFGVQFFSLTAGNRWQVFLYDHLGMRILLDPQDTAFFVEKGLPLSDALLEITALRGSQYQKLINESAELKPVKDWVTCCGKTAYIQYLLADPWRTLSEPFANWRPLLDGSLRGYRNPHNGVAAMPQKLLQLSNFFFRQQPWALAGLGLACLAGLAIYLRGLGRPGSPNQAAWPAVVALAVPILPMMWFVWWAEPMEIERHAAQVILQFRLAAFISLALLAGSAAARLFREPE